MAYSEDDGTGYTGPKEALTPTLSHPPSAVVPVGQAETIRLLRRTGRMGEGEPSPSLVVNPMGSSIGSPFQCLQHLGVSDVHPAAFDDHAGDAMASGDKRIQGVRE